MSESKEAEKKPNLGGRPSKYNDLIQKKADEYVNGYSLYMELKHKDKNNNDVITHVPNSIPSIEGLALELGLSRETIYQQSSGDYAKCQFSDTLERLKQKQKQFLLHHGLLKNYDASFAKFVSVNMTDMRDKIENTHDLSKIEINIPSEKVGKL